MADTGLILARAATYATLLPAAGLPFYLATAGRVAAVSRIERRVVVMLALGALLASVWWAMASVAAMAALPLSRLDRETVTAVLGATPLGTVLAVRAAALIVLALAALCRVPMVLAALPALVALATCAYTGHAGATEGTAGTLHRVGNGVHLAAAACWIGALLSLAGGALGREPGERLGPRLTAFARTGTVIVALLLATGIANTLLIAGWPVMWTSAWTLLLGAKVALFGMMLGLAGLNRWYSSPALARRKGSARRQLRLSLAVETALALGVLVLVAALGVLDPAGTAG